MALGTENPREELGWVGLEDGGEGRGADEEEAENVDRLVLFGSCEATALAMIGVYENGFAEGEELGKGQCLP